MRKSICLFVFASLLIPILGQSAPTGDIARLVFVKVKPGMEAEWETAYKEHLAWHREQNDPWDWMAFQIQSGVRTGQYVVRTGEHSWAEFDKRTEMDQADQAHAQKTLGKYMESVEIGWAETLTDLSSPPTGTTPPAVLMVSEFEVLPGKSYEFLSVVGKFGGALKKAKWGDPAIWTRTIAGAEGEVYSLVSFHQNFASLATPEKSFLDAAESVLGHMEMAHLMETFSSCVKSSRTNMILFRPDLSYAASAQ